MYAWKLIFSHTAHDDFKQTQLKSTKEQHARLDRVEQRSRMILACYCVHSERAWLREASKDLHFVGQIWNPKKALDPNDPDFERHCRETYEGVEDFLYQCVPVAHPLDDVAPFLLGAGVYFMLKEVFHYSSDTPAAEAVQRADAFLLDDTMLHPSPSCSHSFSLAQRQLLGRYELIDLLGLLSQWQPHRESGESRKEALDGDETPILSTSELFSPFANLSRFSTRCRSCTKANSANAGKREPPLSFPQRARLACLPPSIVPARRPCLPLSDLPEAEALQYTPKKQEERVSRLFAQWWQTSGGAVRNEPYEERFSSSGGTEKVLTVVYPKGFLVGLSEALAYELFGLRLSLAMCEDLDCVE
jgi:hypothetical protein